MTSVREHLQNAHSLIAAHHRSLAECHKSAMAKAVDSMQKFHKEAMAAHEEAADAHEALCKECAKAIASDLHKMVPTNVSAVAPTAPVRPVLRHGQREIPLSETVDPRFAKLVALDERDEN